MIENRWMIILAASLVALAVLAIIVPRAAAEPSIQYATAAPW